MVASVSGVDGSDEWSNETNAAGPEREEWSDGGTVSLEIPCDVSAAAGRGGSSSRIVYCTYGVGIYSNSEIVVGNDFLLRWLSGEIRRRCDDAMRRDQERLP
jgi:hypothetical protein